MLSNNLLFHNFQVQLLFSILDPITIPESTIIPELVKPVPSNLSKNNVQLQNIDSPSEFNIMDESNVSTDQSSIVYFVTKNIDKKYFLSKLEQENENNKKMINKIVNYSLSNIIILAD